MKTIQPGNQPQPKGHYSPGIALMFSIMLVFISGQFGCNKGEQMSAVANTSNIETQQDNQNAISNIETKVGFVSDEQTAIAIAVKAWIPIYGKGQIDNEKPYRAKKMVYGLSRVPYQKAGMAAWPLHEYPKRMGRF